MRRLGTAHIDLLYLHIDDPDVEFDETLLAVDELIRAGPPAMPAAHVGATLVGPQIGVVDYAFASYSVAAFFCDVAYWETDVDAWRDEYGETLRQVCRDPALPAFTVVTRWRRRHPEFDSALKLHKAVAFRAQMAARAGPTEALTQEIGRRIAEGLSLAQLCAAPDMPHLQTFMRWRRDRPAFAAAVEDACDFRDWVLADRMVHVLKTDTDRTEFGALKRRAASLGGRGPRGG